MRKNQTKEQNKMRKKIKVLNEIFDGSVFCGAMLGGFTAITLIIGGVAGVTSKMSMQAKANEIYESAEYQMVASEGISVLDQKLANGEIGQNEYDEGIDAIYSIPAVLDYAAKADDAELASFVKSYSETKEMADVTLKTGLLTFGTSSAAMLGCAAVAKKAAKKKQSELEESELFNVQNSFDLGY